MYLSRKPRPGHDPHAAPATPVLAITVWSLAYPVAVAGHIERDEAGTPAWVDAPYALHRTAPAAIACIDASELQVPAMALTSHGFRRSRRPCA
jgi:hypothetical protein